VVLPASSSALATIAMDLLLPRGHCGRSILGVFRSLQTLCKSRRPRTG
jgi:hypothetical protein